MPDLKDYIIIMSGTRIPINTKPKETHIPVNTNADNEQQPKQALNSSGKPIKGPCCVCEQTRAELSECLVMKNEQSCADVKLRHLQCLKSFGFNSENQ